ncbi:potassium channel family protein, partial [Paramuribaculum intestinale]
MRYLIIGLGIYGANLAIDLTNMGHEVIGADKNPSLVESIKDFISTAYIIDSTDEMSLSVLPLKNVDLVIVAIGENFGASIRTVALLKKLEVKHIFARAIDKLHEAILEGFHIDRILTPEQRAASDLVNEMGLGAEIESMRIDDEHYVLKFPAPDFFTGS